MKDHPIKAIFAVCLAAALAAGSIPAAELAVRADTALEQSVAAGLNIRESEISQLMTEDLTLPTAVEGLADAVISYSIPKEASAYAAIDGNQLKITRPYAGAGDFKFTLTATVTAGGESCTKEFPLIIREGLADDSYAGYIYTCFAADSNGSDVQQVHFFLSEDGLNWTALNGNNPAFQAGVDYLDNIQSSGSGSVNYQVKSGTDITATVSGDASVLFPFEGDDQGIRDPYLIRGSRADGSDAKKVWLLATDLNTMASQYGGSLSANTVGNWGTMSSQGSTSLFVYETEDWVNWERRYIDVGTTIGAGAAWAPEAVYNPEKDNYLVYWSCRISADGYARNRLYCNETEDFVTFGPTKLYEEEAFYQKWGTLIDGNDGYGNIDTSQLWVADEDGNPYGTLYRVVKDETNNHIELMSAETVLDAAAGYDSSEPVRITPYEKDGTVYATLEDISGLNDYEKAEVVYHWFQDEATGNHFTYLSQQSMESYAGAYEGATMFKFFDRDEWCVMIDYYGNNAVRYEPYVTDDLSRPESITKVTSGYGRTDGDVGCHGGMIAVTVKEYNTLIENYNADPQVDNYHEISYLQVDKRELADTMQQLEAAADDSQYSDLAKQQFQILYNQAAALYEQENAASADIQKIINRTEAVIRQQTADPDPADQTEPDTSKQTDKNTNTTTTTTAAAKQAASVKLSNKKLTIGVKEKVTLTAAVLPAAASQKVTWKSSKKSVATVNSKGKVTARKKGKTIITAVTENGKQATCTITVKKAPKQIVLNKTKVTLKKNKTFTVKVKKLKPSGSASNKITYTSNHKKVATVTKKGKIKAKKKGKATITVKTYNKIKAKIKVTVK